MKFKFKQYLTLAALGFGAFGAAHAQFTLDGQYRPRAEFRNGFKKSIETGVDPAAFIEHRARLTAQYKKEKLGVKLSIQDIRIWGETGQINKSDGLLSVHEVYGEYYASPVSTFRIGRQEVAYDGDRFIGTLNWAAQARALDAVRYLYKNDSTGFSFDLMVTWNQDGQLAGQNPEPAKTTGTLYTTGVASNGSTIFNLATPKSQQLLHATKKFGKHSVGLMAVHEIRESWEFNAGGNPEVIGGPFSQYHFGLSPTFVFGDIKIGAQGYFSGGTFDRSYDVINPAQINERSLEGYMFNASIQHTSLPGKPLIGFDFISGDDQSSTDKIEGWAPLYGTNHKWYGHMDYFFVGNGHGINGSDSKDNLSSGLIDVYLKTSFNLGEKSKLQGHLHAFMSPTEVRDQTDVDPTATQNSYLGTEIDLIFSHKLSENVKLQVGYSQIFTTDAMQEIKGQYVAASNDYVDIKGIQNWAFVMIDFTPQFLNKKL